MRSSTEKAFIITEANECDVGGDREGEKWAVVT